MRGLNYPHSFEVYRELPEALEPLRELAYNLRWSWDPVTQDLFKGLDPALWKQVERNPIELIAQVSDETLAEMAADPVYLARLAKCHDGLRDYLTKPTWFDERFGEESGSTLVAYFCAEFGIHESLPIYSGGLGILAGDHLKAASDLGIPLVGVGLLYARGYFRQHLSGDGWQVEEYPTYDRYRLPLRLVRGDDGMPVRISVDFPDRTVTCQIWKAIVGRVTLYLLDSNILDNDPTDQSITDTLYGGDEDMRIRQETILGIGGYRALHAMGIRPSVCHMNEGHAAFLSLERLRLFIEEHGCDLRTARQCVVAGNVFTTHTPVPAGFDIFTASLLEKYVAKAVEGLKMPFDQFLRLGKIDKQSADEQFNMAVLAMENANFVNGVSKLHAEVTREMFHRRWPDYPLSEVPVSSVTNGIHTETFLAPKMRELLAKHLGPEFEADASSRAAWGKVYDIPDKVLWELREDMRGDFVRFCRHHVRSQASRGSTLPLDKSAASRILDPRLLTVGFARRFATYKRASLLLRNPERLRSLIFHPERPVQFVFAGKAHPRDDSGKELIRHLVQFIRESGSSDRMVFLEDYDMDVARHMVQGVDLWLNNPRRPMEASGTSGMKLVPNGGLNLSILDGWWAEGYAPGRGWSIGHGSGTGDDDHQDWLDSESLYDLLEREIVPMFYHRSDDGVPTGWVQTMKKSMAELAPTYSTLRMVREYASRFYVPASRSYRCLVADNLAASKDALAWRDRVGESWGRVKILSITDDAGAKTLAGTRIRLKAKVALAGLATSDVRVQVLLGHVKSIQSGSNYDVYELVPVGEEDGVTLFEGDATCGSPGHQGYVGRVVPYHPSVSVASELALVHWEPGTVQA